MKKLMMSLSILTTLLLNSCGIFDDTIDRGVVSGKELIAHTGEEIGKLKTEVIAEISALKTEILLEVKEAVEDVLPNVVDTILNADAVAFLIVVITGLGALVVIVTLLWLIGLLRIVYKWLT